MEISSCLVSHVAANTKPVMKSENTIEDIVKTAAKVHIKVIRAEIVQGMLANDDFARSASRIAQFFDKVFQNHNNKKKYLAVYHLNTFLLKLNYYFRI